MKTAVTMMLAVVAIVAMGWTFSRQAPAADAPSDRIVVMYFHRTQRCPTCLKMGSYSEEAVKTGFAEQIKSGTVEFHYVDFQNPSNAAFTKAYGISGPALIVAKVADNKVVKAGNLRDIWTKVREKEAFLKYVRDNVAALLNAAPETAGTGQPRR